MHFQNSLSLHLQHGHIHYTLSLSTKYIYRQLNSLNIHCMIRVPYFKLSRARFQSCLQDEDSTTIANINLVEGWYENDVDKEFGEVFS